MKKRESDGIADDDRLTSTTNVVVLDRPAVVVAAMNGTMLEDHEVPNVMTAGGESEASA